MFDEKVKSAVRQVANALQVDPAALLAIAEVESGGRAFAMVDGRAEPLIRFEGHYFDQRLTGEERRRARASGLSSPTAGAVRNPAPQAGRWQLLAQASEIDRRAAHESVSWGLGQVMGAHWKWLGFDSVDRLVEEARSGLDGQIRLMARYIEKAGLVDEIRRRDWEAFARAYNGPAYARSRYHSRIAAAYERYRIEEAAASRPVRAQEDRPNPEKATTAEGVADLQRMLSATGYPLKPDGVIGPATKKAIRRFQADNGLTVDGVAGPETLAALRDAAPLGDGGVGAWRRFMRLVRGLFGSATS
ncbi:N-acetylmuramidase domain-containing protein [Arvimicrobium flavum]|uniref:N-acetylmuramidase domain-containing protein n=1 Tax=Arvimicrobium flavum TaxID=3393320 RepID=UPI00237C4E2F|nr:N-acetylmuramidase domain-containing protein [Mesorhizobium shangrilense]